MTDSTLKAGSLLKNGEYRIVRFLGQGGFGFTYEAIQLALDRKVAVKEFFMKDCCERSADTSIVTVPTLGNRVLVDKFRGKFIREAQMIAAMEHPHIVRIHDVFEENGTAYYVMENLPGGSLADKVKKGGPLSEAKAEKYIREVSDALAYVHERKTVHLDVKPSNILLNAKGDAVLIDFGISKHYDTAGEQTSSTPVGISKGYAPLEQGRDGDVSQFTPATDIYALGATLYYLVTGLVPPEASIVNEDGLECPSGLSDRLWRVIEKSMQPRRKDRPQSIAEFLRLLDAPEQQEESDDEETKLVKPKKDKQEESVILSDSEESNRPKKKFPSWLIALASALVVALVVWLVIPKGHSDRQSAVLSAATGSSNGHEWVDLGLSVKWATCNVGASSPGDYGNYYAWGESTTKSDYSWSNLKYCTDSTGDHFSKYVRSSDTGYWSGSGSPDNKTRLEMSDDAARQNWGGSWRMPTDAEWTELLDNCTWTWTSQRGHNGNKGTSKTNGYKVTSKTNGNSIFLPAAGHLGVNSLFTAGSYGYYWSSSLGSGVPWGAWSVFFDSSEVYRHSGNRCYGYSVRPVTE